MSQWPTGGDTQEERHEREEVMQALERATGLAERYFAKAHMDHENLEESNRVAELCVRMRALLQDDTDSEGEGPGREPSAEPNQTKRSSAGAGSSTEMSDAARSQPPEAEATRPQANRFMAEKGFESLLETKDGFNLVHLCCQESAKRSATACVA